MSVQALMEKADQLGLKLAAVNGRIRCSPKASIPEDFIQAVVEHRKELFDVLRLRAVDDARVLDEPEVRAELHDRQKASLDCWVLEEWRRASIPQWREILEVSITSSDKVRAEYARWMLSEVLQADER